jgi:PAS domain S-box-containing protein
MTTKPSSSKDDGLEAPHNLWQALAWPLCVILLLLLLGCMGATAYHWQAIDRDAGQFAALTDSLLAGNELLLTLERADVLQPEQRLSLQRFQDLDGQNAISEPPGAARAQAAQMLAAAAERWIVTAGSQTSESDGRRDLRDAEARYRLALITELAETKSRLAEEASSSREYGGLSLLLAGILLILATYMGRQSRLAARQAADQALAAPAARSLAQMAQAQAGIERLLQMTIDSVDAGIVIFDAFDQIVFCNEAYRAFTQLPPALSRPGTSINDISRFFYERYPESRAGLSLEAAVAARRADMRAGKPAVEWQRGERWFLLTDCALRDGSVVGLWTDITAVKHAQSALAERSELLEIALRASSDGLWDWNVEANTNHLSPRWKALLGYAEHEMNDNVSLWQAPIHPEDRDAVARQVEAHLDGRAAFDMEYRMQTKTGEWRWFHVRGEAVRDGDGRPKRMAGFTQDIHERKAQALEIEKMRAMLNDVIEAINGGIARFDAEERLIFCNRRFGELYGFPPELLRPGTSGRALVENFFDRNFPDAPPAVRETFVENRVKMQRELRMPMERQVGDRWYLVGDTHGPDGDTVSLHTDITDIKKTQHELTLAIEKAEAASVAKSQFLANMSHELRTPLNGVIGMLQMLQSPDINPPYDDYVRVALRSGRSLLELINDVLDFSRIQSDALSLEVVDFGLQELANDALAPIVSAAQQKGLEVGLSIAPELPAALQGDPLRLRQVLVNLLGNALKFTAQGSLQLKIERSATAAHVRYAVSDTGIGIAREQLSSIFERFSQGDASTTRRFGGAGLGLAISQELVQRMGGRLEIKSVPNEGTTIWFELPLVVGALPDAAATSELLGRRFTGKVLVVDDVETNRSVAHAMLQRLGLAVEVADTALSAIDRAASGAFDLIFMDCQMPEVDGYEATRRLLEQLGERCPPVVAMTAHVEPAQRDEARAAGMRDYLAKPLSMEALAAVLARWLGPEPSVAPSPVQFRTRAGEEIIASAKLAELREAFDVDGLRGLYAAFGESMETLIERVDGHLQARDAEALVQVFHAIKGTSANVGATRIAVLVSRMGNAASQRNFAALGQAAALLRAAMEEVRLEVLAQAAEKA